MEKIWVLFSVENQYDQPDNNMKGWWKQKPSIEELSKYMELDMKKDEDVIGIVGVWRGESTRIDNTDYRLQEVKEGMIKPK